MPNKKIEDRINSIKENQTEEYAIERDANILMANYLSEIERLQKIAGLKRKDLAEKINTSASYLTQVFRGDKPLNFYTLAKIKRVLNINFKVITTYKNINGNSSSNEK